MPEIYAGSSWRKWDLHVHSHASPDSNMAPSDIVDRMIEQNVSVFSVTDHFSTRNVDEFHSIVEGKQKEGIDIHFLPGLELRTDKGDKSVHLIGIFPDMTKGGHKVTSKFLYDELLAKIDCTDTTLIDLGKSKLADGLGDEDYLERGQLEFNCPFEKASELIRNLGGITIVHAGTKSNSIEGEMGHAKSEDPEELLNSLGHTKEKLMKEYIDVCELPNWNEPSQKQRSFYLSQFNKPSIISSDSHKIEGIGEKYTWIKGDATFECLRQVKFEPELRIRLQEEDPSEVETYIKIDSLSINFPDELQIKDQESGDITKFCLNGSYQVGLSNNLTCIIGGRGSGKTSIAHIIYNLWPEHDKGKLSLIGSPLVSLKLLPSALSQVSELTDSRVPNATEFFFQNELEDFAKDINKMSQLLRQRLYKLSFLDGDISLEDIQNEWITLSDSFEELVNAYDEIADIDANIVDYKNNITSLKLQTEVIKSGEYKDYQKAIGELTGVISKQKAYKTDHDKINKQIDSLISIIEKLDWSPDQGSALLDEFKGAVNKYKERLEQSLKEYSEEYDSEDYETKLNEAKEELKIYLEKKGLAAENIQEIADANQQIKELEESIRLAEIEKTPYQDVYKKYETLKEDYSKKYNKYSERISKVSLSLQQMLHGLSISDKEITFSPFVDYSILKSELVEFIKESITSEVTLRSDALERLIFEDESKIKLFIEDINKLKETVNASPSTGKHKQILQEMIIDEVFLHKIQLRLMMHAYDVNNIRMQTKLGANNLRNTSFGERCGIVISIIVVAGTNPIVIDQPEDHLDGKFISEVLVPLIRKQKHNRQILLITRDANVVIGSDAELMHIMDPSGERSNIIPSSIENLDNREKYIWILDGGVDAFMKREKKYDV